MHNAPHTILIAELEDELVAVVVERLVDGLHVHDQLEPDRVALAHFLGRAAACRGGLVSEICTYTHLQT